MVYLIPSFLSENAVQTIPAYVVDAAKQCEVFFVENARTARRFLRRMDPSFVIDDRRWFEIGKDEPELVQEFRNCISAGNTIGIISEAGCPGIADPGQVLVAAAQQLNAQVKPLVGPNSVLLALMASGLNGQQFSFHGYLPINSSERVKVIRNLEADSAQKGYTQIFIETPYRNNALLGDILRSCNPNSMLCIAADITSESEWIKTLTVADWRKVEVDLHKRPALFLLGTSDRDR